MIEYRPGQQEYTTELIGFSDRLVYVIRVYLVNTAGEVIAVTDEFNVGSPTAASCTGQCIYGFLLLLYYSSFCSSGPQGVPPNAEAYYVGQTTLTYSWGRPQCDESYGPVEGYEYAVSTERKPFLSDVTRICGFSFGMWIVEGNQNVRRLLALIALRWII